MVEQGVVDIMEEQHMIILLQVVVVHHLYQVMKDVIQLKNKQNLLNTRTRLFITVALFLLIQK